MPSPKQEKQLVEMCAYGASDPLLFVTSIFPWGVPNGPLEKEDGPDEWQIDVLEEIRKAVENSKSNPEAFNKALRIAVSSGHGIGKAQPLSLVVDTPDGAKRWGDLQPGDKLFGADGTPTRIKARHDQGVRDIYKVTFSDGSHTFADGDHNWQVKGRQQRRQPGDWVVMTTKEILKAGVKRSNGVATARQWELPSHKPVEYKTAMQPIDPYILGVWLGDGSKGTGAVTSADQDIFMHAQAAGYTLGTNRDCHGGAARTHTLMGLKKQLESIGVLGVPTAELAVPVNYMEASASQRIAVLQGLLDTDGWVEQSGTIAFGSISGALTDDVVWLARSLGLIARKNKPKVKWYRDAQGSKVPGQPFYTCSITWNGKVMPFRLQRKIDRLKLPQHRYQTRWIDSIEFSHQEEAMCVTVDAEDSLYLTNDFIVTHNTALTSWIIYWFISTRPHPQIIVTANTQNQLSGKTWRELAKWHKMALNEHWFTHTATKFFHKKYPDTWFASAIPWSENNSEAFAGTHEKHVLVLFDEASAVADVIWEVVEGAMTTDGAMWLAFGNPTRNTGRFAECFTKFRDRWVNMKIDSRTAKMTNKAQIEEWREDYGEDSDFFRVRVRGEFPRAGSNQFIDRERVEACASRYADRSNELQPLLLGVDVARFGEDQSVFVLRRGRKIEAIQRYRNLDLATLSQKVAGVISAQQVDCTFIDGTGLGAGVVDMLRALGFECFDVQSAALPSEASKDRYLNKRAEMWDLMRLWLETGDIPVDQELIEDLTGLEYQYNSKGKLQLEKKSDMKKRGLRSPDVADALALTFAFPVSPKGFQRKSPIMDFSGADDVVGF